MTEQKHPKPGASPTSAGQQANHTSAPYDDYDEYHEEILKMVMFSGCQPLPPAKQPRQEQEDDN